jgi:outer membrane protein assembly factor BamB
MSRPPTVDQHLALRRSAPILAARAASFVALIVAANVEGAASAVAPATMTVVWRVPTALDWAAGLPQVLVTEDAREVIIGDARGIMARSVADGQLLWRRSDIGTPIVLGGPRLIGLSADRQIVALDPRTGRQRWKSSIGTAGKVALAADASTAHVVRRERRACRRHQRTPPHH